MQKISRGRGFRGALNYAFERDSADAEPGRLLGGNMSGQDARQLAAEFGQVRRLRPDIERPVWHNALRLKSGETLTDAQWVAIADDYMKRMGFTGAHPRAYVLHDDADGQHIHIVASRVSAEGKVYLGKNENLASTRHIQALERDHGLAITKGPTYDPDIEANGRARKAIAQTQRCLRSAKGGAIRLFGWGCILLVAWGFGLLLWVQACRLLSVGLPLKDMEASV